MKVAAFLIQCPQWGPVPPLALAQLAACLKARCVPVRAIDLSIALYHRRGERYRHAWAWDQTSLWVNDDVKVLLADFAADIRELCVDPLPQSEPVLVGFSVNECSWRASLHVAALIRAARPQAVIVFGGQAFALPARAEQALRSGAVDAVAVGDGEETVCDLAEAVGAGRPPESVAGLRILRDGRVRETSRRPPVDLDRIPCCDFEALDLGAYDIPDSLYRSALMIMASRGCPWRCQFCGNRAPWTGYRAMSGQRVYAEIKHQLALRPRLDKLKFYDITFNGDIRRVDELCGLLAADPAAALPWSECNCIVRPEMTPALLGRMAAAGCRHITYGLESGSDRVLKLMGKRQTAAAEQVVRDTTSAGIRVTANFMFGYPGETEADFQETLGFVRRIHPHVTYFYPSRTFLTMEPLSEMAGRREELGVDDGVDIFWQTKDGSNTYPVRLDRYERFCRLLAELGSKEIPGVNTSLELYRWFSLAEYHEARGELAQALECHCRYLALDPANAVVARRQEACRRRLAGRSSGTVCDA